MVSSRKTLNHVIDEMSPHLKKQVKRWGIRVKQSLEKKDDTIGENDIIIFYKRLPSEEHKEWKKDHDKIQVIIDSVIQEYQNIKNENARKKGCWSRLFKTPLVVNSLSSELKVNLQALTAHHHISIVNSLMLADLIIRLTDLKELNQKFEPAPDFVEHIKYYDLKRPAFFIQETSLADSRTLRMRPF